MACWNCCCLRVEVDGGGGNAPNYMVAEIEIWTWWTRWTRDSEIWWVWQMMAITSSNSPSHWCMLMHLTNTVHTVILNKQLSVKCEERKCGACRSQVAVPRWFRKVKVPLVSGCKRCKPEDPISSQDTKRLELQKLVCNFDAQQKMEIFRSPNCGKSMISFLSMLFGVYAGIGTYISKLKSVHNQELRWWIWWCEKSKVQEASSGGLVELGKISYRRRMV